MKILVVLVLLSAVASADAPHALVVHVPPLASPAGAPIELEAMIDAPYAERVVVHYRALGEQTWHDTTFDRSTAGGWYASLPPAAPPGVEYYIAGTDAGGAEIDHFASAASPHVVLIEPSLDDRLEVQDRARVAGLVNEVSIDVSGHDFGNRYNLADDYVRGEIVFTHRLLRTLHEIGVGFGTIEGNTPDAMEDASTTKGARYGFGQVRVRLHPSVFVDGRVGLSVSQEGFGATTRGQLTFGKPWRSCLQVGADYLSGLGPTAWVRLQWDTAPPLLMGASMVRTDLPGAMTSATGLYIAYDLAYRLSPRVMVRGQVSYGPRDGVAHVGGGLGTSFAF
jgi:hypothetical protein